MDCNVQKVRSPVKIAGGKARLVPELLKRVPEKFGRYYEPFLGGGSLFLALAAEGRLSGDKGPILSDSNYDLIMVWMSIAVDLKTLLKKLALMPNDKDFFDAMRQQDSSKMSRVDTAARFIYLNKTCFNGLHRVNKKGQFNVPFANYPKPKICDEENLSALFRVLAETGAGIGCCDYTYHLRTAKKGDFVYFDPPYWPRSKTSSFVAYGKDGFTWDDQVALADTAVALKKRGVHVLLSNSDTPETRKLYRDRGFKIEKVMAARSINVRGDGRGKISELLVR